MKTPQEVINYFREEGWCLNESKMKLIIHAYNLGVEDVKEALKSTGSNTEVSQ